MDPLTEMPAPTRSRTTGRSTNSSSSQSAQTTYGYHNTFHTHAQITLDSPPSYACANSSRTLQHLREKARAEAYAVRTQPSPPPYSCTVELEGVLGVRQELCSPFQVSGTREWNDAYLVLRGTQLTIYRIKQPNFLSKNKAPGPGRLIKTFSLQHAEVGVASDFKKTPLTPKSPFAHLVPSSARHKLYETDPHLFEPVREHVIRLRLETEQFLLCATTPEEMLDWVENLCAAIDISPPLEDRSEPRYRSLPRRSRRQRILDSSRLGENLENLSSLEAGRRIIAEQERIIRQLYPHLGASEAQEAPAPHGTDPEIEDFDPEDVRFPTRRPGSASMSRTASREGEGEASPEDRPSSSATISSDPKTAARLLPSPSQVLRYRRRCAPVLLASSPRVSDVVFMDGTRMRINVKEHILVDYVSHPPRYDAHNFPKTKRPSRTQASQNASRTPSAKTTPPAINIQRPQSPIREHSDDSLAFGYDLGSTSSEHTGDEITSTSSSGPPSPTALTQAKGDAARQLAAMGKRRTSEDGRDNGLNAVALGVGLLI